jgi:hypothetical protein
VRPTDALERRVEHGVEALGVVLVHHIATGPAQAARKPIRNP